MINKIYSLKNSKVLKNGMWLYVLQIFNTVIPLATLPYIMRVLGASQYGVFSSALNLVGYFQIVVEYGFNMLGTRKVAMAKTHDEISKIYSVIVINKMLFTCSTFIIMIILSIFLKINTAQIICMIVLYIMILGTSLQQTWLFQGLQEMKYITIISVISRTISVILIFTLINDAKDLYLYTLLYSASFFLLGLISVLIVKYKFNINLKKVIILNLIHEIKEGWYLFTTSAMSKVFTSVGLTVLQFTTTNTEVGVYAAIQKIPYIITLLYAPIGQVMYPYISQHFGHSIELVYSKVTKLSIFIITFITAVSLIIIFNSKFIIFQLYGMEYLDYSNLLIPLLVWLIFSILNNLLGTQILVTSGHSKEYSIASRIGAISIIFFSVGLGILYGVYGVAIATMFSEIILTLAILYQIKKIRKQIKIL